MHNNNNIHTNFTYSPKQGNLDHEYIVSLSAANILISYVHSLDGRN